MRAAATASALAALALTGCVAALAHATPDDAARVQARWPGTTVASLEEGRRLYTTRCTGCHSLRLPERYTEPEWAKHLVEMRTEAKLGPAEAERIEHFILTITSRPPPRDGGLAGKAGAGPASRAP